MKQDKRKAGVMVERSRSKLIDNLIALVEEGAIGLEVLEEFSEELQEIVKNIVRGQSI